MDRGEDMTNKNKINSILDMMDDLQEKLLALPDDMLLSIDPHDNESIDEGAGFLKPTTPIYLIFLLHRRRWLSRLRRISV